MQIAYIFLILSVIMMLSLFGCASRPNPTSSPPTTSHIDNIPTARPVLDTITGNFRNQISILENNMPRADSEKYVVPTGKQHEDFAQLASMLIANDLESAVDIAAKNNFELHYYTDRGDNQSVSYLLREQKAIQTGWGLYALRRDSTNNIIIEVPHPRSDRRTSTVALDIYRALDARALLIAGSVRNANRDGSADVAHAPESIFQSVHLALSKEIQTESGDVIILQIHGFHSSNHEGYPQVVFGLGEKPLPAEVAIADKIKEALSRQGISAGICTHVESDLKDLCATTNVQGRSMKEGAFIHIELDEIIRRHDAAFITALVQAYGNGSLDLSTPYP